MQLPRSSPNPVESEKGVIENALSEKADLPKSSAEDEYHLEISGFPKDHLFDDEEGSYKIKSSINDTIDLINRKANSELPRNYKCPVVHSSHVVEKIMQGRKVTKTVLKIAFRLREGLDSALLNRHLTELCVAIFSKGARRFLIEFSELGIFGLSPVRGTVFSGIWNRVFGLSITNDNELLESYQRSCNFKRVSVPSWFSTGCLAIATTSIATAYIPLAIQGLGQTVGFEVIKNLGLVPAYASGALSIAGTAISAGLAFMELKSRNNEDREARSKFEKLDWKRQLDGFLEDADAILKDLNDRASGTVLMKDADAQLFEALWRIIEKADDVFMTNKEAYMIYEKLQKELQQKAKNNLCAGGIQLGVAATVGAIEIAVASVFLIPVAGALIVSGGIWVAMAANANIREGRCTKKVNCFINVANIVAGIWGIALRTYYDLGAFHCNKELEAVIEVRLAQDRKDLRKITSIEMGKLREEIKAADLE